MTALGEIVARNSFVLATQAGEGSDAVPPVPNWVWAAFIAFVVALLIVDLKVVMKDEHEISTKEAAWYSAFWIALGVSFTGVVAWWQGGQAATEYITGYVIEKSLSVDNVFVWAVLFSFFAVPAIYQHRVLFWGIFGALVMRAIFIFGGIALLESLKFVEILFGAFLLFTAYRIARSDEVEVHPEHNPVLKRMRRIIPHTDDYRGHSFFVKENGRRLATPLFTTLIAVELTDVLFAVDSIPAILAITRNEFLVFSSNAFAILGLRALYFLLAGMQDRFIYLNKGLGIILGFVGVKLVLAYFDIHIPILLSLGFIAVVLTLTIWLSLRRAPEGKPTRTAAELEAEQVAERSSEEPVDTSESGTGATTGQSERRE